MVHLIRLDLDDHPKDTETNPIRDIFVCLTSILGPYHSRVVAPMLWWRKLMQIHARHKGCRPIAEHVVPRLGLGYTGRVEREIRRLGRSFTANVPRA